MRRKATRVQKSQRGVLRVSLTATLALLLTPQGETALTGAQFQTKETLAAIRSAINSGDVGVQGAPVIDPLRFADDKKYGDGG